MRSGSPIMLTLHEADIKWKCLRYSEVEHLFTVQKVHQWLVTMAAVGWKSWAQGEGSCRWQISVNLKVTEGMEVPLVFCLFYVTVRVKHQWEAWHWMYLYLILLFRRRHLAAVFIGSLRCPQFQAGLLHTLRDFGKFRSLPASIFLLFKEIFTTKLVAHNVADSSLGFKAPQGPCQWASTKWNDKDICVASVRMTYEWFVVILSYFSISTLRLFVKFSMLFYFILFWNANNQMARIHYLMDIQYFMQGHLSVA